MVIFDVTIAGMQQQRFPNPTSMMMVQQSQPQQNDASYQQQMLQQQQMRMMRVPQQQVNRKQYNLHSLSIFVLNS